MLKRPIRLLLLSLGLLVATLPFVSTAQAQSCSGYCGDSPDGNCYCDDACFEYGDCCADVCTYCPTLSGCGGGGADCGSISYEGCCSGNTLQWCESGALQTLDCSENPSCGWSTEAGYYDCGTAGTADPSGLNPINCSGGTGPVCGNGACEAGESAATCPADCGTTAVCGNGACEAGETEQSCPADCSGTTAVCGNGVCEGGESQQTCPTDCGSGCGDKECGFDGQGNPCGTCPEGYYCTWDGYCESDTPCVPECAGKQCGDDGCNGSCGDCPANLICSEYGTCVSPYSDVTVQPEQDVACTPDCTDRVCGDDGCGGSCGECPEGYGCTENGLCQEGYVPIETDVTGSTEDPYGCPEGQTLLYGKCVAATEDEGKGGACSTGTRCSPMASLLLLLLALAALATRRNYG